MTEITLMHNVQVPSSSTRMLEKSLESDSDTFIYDLEDSVAPSEKESARTSLIQFLKVSKTESDSPRTRAQYCFRRLLNQVYHHQRDYLSV